MKISVLTPSLNSGRYLPRAIKSVVDQNYTQWEHIVADGCSTDNTLDILKSNPHLRWISKPDKGQSDAMNKAFAMATGDIIVYLNADDYFEKEAFRSVIDAFEQSTATDIVVGSLIIVYCDNSGEIVETTRQKPHVRYPDILYPYKYRFPVNPSAYFYRRSVQSRIGSFPIENHYSMDYWFILRAFRQCHIKQIDSILGYYWIDGKNKTSVNSNPNETYDVAKNYCLENHLAYLPLFLLTHFVNAYLRPFFYSIRRRRQNIQGKRV
jgi:glycosyltransferase involved in cell wall biosynthesis